MREAWHGTNHWGRDFQKNKGFLPTLSTETTYHGSCERNLNLDEWFNLQESEAAHKGAQRAKGKDKPLYTQGLLPWRLGFDASRIEECARSPPRSCPGPAPPADPPASPPAPRLPPRLPLGRLTRAVTRASLAVGSYLVATRKSGERLRAYRSDEEGVATPAGGFTLSIGRHSTLPSEACTGELLASPLAAYAPTPTRPGDMLAHHGTTLLRMGLRAGPAAAAVTLRAGDSSMQ